MRFAKSVKRTFTLSCLDENGCSVVFEPLGSEHLLSPEDDFRVELVGPPDDMLEISYSPSCIVVWLEPKTEIRVWNRLGDELAM